MNDTTTSASLAERALAARAAEVAAEQARLDEEQREATERQAAHVREELAAFEAWFTHTFGVMAHTQLDEEGEWIVPALPGITWDWLHSGTGRKEWGVFVNVTCQRCGFPFNLRVANLTDLGEALSVAEGCTGCRQCEQAEATEEHVESQPAPEPPPPPTFSDYRSTEFVEVAPGCWLSWRAVKHLRGDGEHCYVTWGDGADCYSHSTRAAEELLREIDARAKVAGSNIGEFRRALTGIGDDVSTLVDVLGDSEAGDLTPAREAD
ncbi:MAG: hypothetical protein ACRDJN_22705 [Chloroflexota bacterium]